MKPDNSNRPTHAVFVVEGQGKNAFWTRIGGAWPHEDGEGFNMRAERGKYAKQR